MRQAIIAAILLGSLAAAQTQPQSKPSTSGAQQQQQQQPTTAPGTQGTQPAQGQPAPQPTTPAPVPGTRQPQAKTQEEFTALQAAFAIQDPAAAEAAANDFATKFPNSDYRHVLYDRVMDMYRQQNNADKTVDLGRKSLEVAPDDPYALVTLASVLSERTRETDLDKEDRYAEAMKDANKALETVNTSITASAAITPEQIEMARNQLRSMAYTTLGTIAMNRKDDPAAAENFKKALDADKSTTDPVVYLRYSVVLDRLKRYPEALQAANKVVELAPANSAASNLGKQEQQRLQKLMAASATSGTPAQPGTPAAPQQQPTEQPQTTPK